MAIKTVISFFTGLIVMTCLLLIGVDYAILWGVLAFLLNFIPTFGSILAAIPAVLLATVQLGLGTAALTAFVYAVINVVVGSVIEPRLMRQGLESISTGWFFFPWSSGAGYWARLACCCRYH